jgi:hypothetical protein
MSIWQIALIPVGLTVAGFIRQVLILVSTERVARPER